MKYILIIFVIITSLILAGYIMNSSLKQNKLDEEFKQMSGDPSEKILAPCSAALGCKYGDSIIISGTNYLLVKKVFDTELYDSKLKGLILNVDCVNYICLEYCKNRECFQIDENGKVSVTGKVVLGGSSPNYNLNQQYILLK